MIVSPYARRDYVSHVVHDHTSILKLIETKWNLPPLTRRDAEADDLLDCARPGRAAHARGRPTYLPPHSRRSARARLTPVLSTEGS